MISADHLTNLDASSKVKLTDKEHFVSKCFLPPESAVISNYFATGLLVVLYLLVALLNRFRLVKSLLKLLSKKFH